MHLDVEKEPEQRRKAHGDAEEQQRRGGAVPGHDGKHEHEDGLHRHRQADYHGDLDCLPRCQQIWAPARPRTPRHLRRRRPRAITTFFPSPARFRFRFFCCGGWAARLTIGRAVPQGPVDGAQERSAAFPDDKVDAHDKKHKAHGSDLHSCLRVVGCRQDRCDRPADG